MHVNMCKNEETSREELGHGSNQHQDNLRPITCIYLKLWSTQREGNLASVHCFTFPFEKEMTY